MIKYIVISIAFVLTATVWSINLFPSLFGMDDDEEYVDNFRGIEEFENETGATVWWDDNEEMQVDWPDEE